MPLYAADNLDCNPNNLIGLKNDSCIVLGNFVSSDIQSITPFTSSAYLVSFAPPYISPKTPHQYHCFILFFILATLILLPSANNVHNTTKGMNCVAYVKSLEENILSSCNIFSASTKPAVKSSQYFLYSSSVRFKTSFFLQLTVPPFLYVDKSVHAVKKSVADIMDNKSPSKYFSFYLPSLFLVQNHP